MLDAWALRRGLEKFKLTNRISFPLQPGRYTRWGIFTVGFGFFDLGFWLRTKFLHYAAGADMVSTHHVVWDEDYGLVLELNSMSGKMSTRQT